MRLAPSEEWENSIVTLEKAFSKFEPGMSVFVSTGISEPRSLVRHLLETQAGNIADLELIQVVSFGEAITPEQVAAHKFRLKTFYPGRYSVSLLAEGKMDYIPCRFSEIPQLIKSGRIQIDAALVQITPPNRAGYCNLGPTVDVARYAMDQATIVIGEINTNIPYASGDTLVHLSDFDFVVRSEFEPYYFLRWPITEIYDKIAGNVSRWIDSGSCIGATVGPLFEALRPYLSRKRDLGIHSALFTDALMDLVKSGAVTNRKKGIFRGKSVASYAAGTPELLDWLDGNPLVEFQGIEDVFNPHMIGMNPQYTAILTASKVGLSGEAVRDFGSGNVTVSAAEALDFVQGARASERGLTIIALPSRGPSGESNIALNLSDEHVVSGLRESVDVIATEYGTAHLRGRTVRERAQAIIELAHPEDRAGLVNAAREHGILYRDQVFVAESQNLYPADMEFTLTLRDGNLVQFRAIKPSDEDEMRRLFYRFSDEAVYYRYFSPVKVMPHSRMQQYVNVDYGKIISIVGFIGDEGSGKIIAEGRYVKHPDRPLADVAFVVDEAFQGKGIASCLLKQLTGSARASGLKGFTADVISSNRSMMRVFEKSGLVVTARFEEGAYELTMMLPEASV
jgi:acyl-CoA hydrolase/GNAT superfamily N-acetyltransferase